MNLTRREFLQVMAAAGFAGIVLPGCGNGQQAASTRPLNDLYDFPPAGNVSLLHITDHHGQLLPIYFREPSINLGVAEMNGRVPHIVGARMLEHFGISHPSPASHAFSYLDFTALAQEYGPVGGYAQLATLVKRMRDQRPGALLLDGGDSWGGGSGTGVWTNAQDMVDAQLRLGVDICTGHWEFTFGADRVMQVIENDYAGRIDFLGQNVRDRDWEEPVFKPYTIREINGVNVAVIGQAFPYTPIANPQWMFPDWSFGIRHDDMQRTVNEARAEGAEVVVVLSHNGMDVDIKLAQITRGIDVILGGHTHDAVPAPMEVRDPDGNVCLVANGGSNGKFLGVMDLDFRDGRIQGYQYRLLPIFANLIDADPEMASYIDNMRNQTVTYDGQTFNMAERLSEELAVTEDLLYRRGNFNGTFDQLICDALMEQIDAEIAFSPGFRWGTSVLPGSPITFENVMDQTGLTYPAVTRNGMTGEMIKFILEDIGDNLFNADPFYQQGGDMVRIGGLTYSMDPTQTIGNRISDLALNGEPLQADKEYIVAGWASIAEEPPGDTGRKIWDVVSDYLQDHQTISIREVNTPRLRGVDGNAGLSL